VYTPRHCTARTLDFLAQVSPGVKTGAGQKVEGRSFGGAGSVCPKRQVTTHSSTHCAFTAASSQSDARPDRMCSFSASARTRTFVRLHHPNFKVDATKTVKLRYLPVVAKGGLGLVRWAATGSITLAPWRVGQHPCNLACLVSGCDLSLNPKHASRGLLLSTAPGDHRPRAWHMPPQRLGDSIPDMHTQCTLQQEQSSLPSAARLEGHCFPPPHRPTSPRLHTSNSPRGGPTSLSSLRLASRPPRRLDPSLQPSTFFAVSNNHVARHGDAPVEPNSPQRVRFNLPLLSNVEPNSNDAAAWDLIDRKTHGESGRQQPPAQASTPDPWAAPGFCRSGKTEARVFSPCPPSPRFPLSSHQAMPQTALEPCCNTTRNPLAMCGPGLGLHRVLIDMVLIRLHCLCQPS
jgi:hypothetical protein